MSKVSYLMVKDNCAMININIMKLIINDEIELI